MFNLNDYEMVEERLKKWWADNPDGRIETELLESSNTRFIVKAHLYRTEADPKPVATGLAQTNIGTNKQTSEYGLELCETSAIGRALANFIYSGKKRASREEIAKATKETITIPRADDPWTTEAKPVPVHAAEGMIKTVFTDAEAIPECKHGPMTHKEGTGKTGKPYYGYVCKFSGVGPGEECKPIWYDLMPSGKWKPQQPKGAK